MQTFLPFSDFDKSAKALDNKRLFKQVVEAKQIICTLQAPDLPNDWMASKSYINRVWQKHPAVKMWIGYEEALKHYFNAFLKESVRRNYNTKENYLTTHIDYVSPYWLGVEPFHRAMRSRLIKKQQDYYLEKWESDQHFNNSLYLWPYSASPLIFMTIDSLQKPKEKYQYYLLNENNSIWKIEEIIDPIIKQENGK